MSISLLGSDLYTNILGMAPILGTTTCATPFNILPCSSQIDYLHLYSRPSVDEIALNTEELKYNHTAANGKMHYHYIWRGTGGIADAVETRPCVTFGSLSARDLTYSNYQTK